MMTIRSARTAVSGTRRFFGRAVFWLVCGLVGLRGWRGRAAAPVVLVRDGQAAAAIAVGRHASPRVEAAARLLRRLLERATGAALPLVAADSGPGPGRNRVVLRIATPADGPLDGDGFLFRYPAAGRLEIVGGSEYGVLFGVQEFLERYAGVRWLFPGRLGEVVPRRQTVAAPGRPLKSEPAFFSRQLSGSLFHGTPEKNPVTRFLLRQRMHGRIHFHHNLLHLFPASRYAKTHPEFFPVVNGARVLPKSDRDYHWQPNLRAKGIVEEAVRNIDAFFDSHPGVNSYSLGMNDSPAWDDSVMKAPDARRNSIGRIDLSDYFFTWANRVAAGVLATHPHKWFGCLAYNELTDPPRKAGVNPHILPFICIDRMGWVDPALRRADMARTRAWHKVAARLAWYDYIYGDQFYKVPRFYPHLMAEYLRFGRRNGVVAYYAEAYPARRWTEGPKLYVLLRLLWNPGIDVDAVLDDWYRCAVGPKAAPALAAYYRFWEEFWMKRVPQTAWFRESAKAACYLLFYRTDYLTALRPGDVEKLDSWMEQVVSRADTPDRKARAGFFYDGWRTVRANIMKYMEIKILEANGPPPGTRLEPVFESDFESPRSRGAAAAGRRRDWRANGMPPGWSYWQRTGSQAVFRWDRNRGKDSRGALELDTAGSDGQPLCFLHTVTVAPNALYRAACDVRTVGVSPGAAVGITVKWQDKSGKWATQFASVDRRLDAPTRGRWKHIEVYVRTPKIENPRLVLMLLVDQAKTGRVWFDNVALARLVPPKP